VVQYLDITYAVNALAGVALVCVLAQVLALCDAKGVGGDDLVECVWCAGEELASVAMADVNQHVVSYRGTRIKYHRM
jgi:hypothetical protein